MDDAEIFTYCTVSISFYFLNVFIWKTKQNCVLLLHKKQQPYNGVFTESVILNI